MRGLGRRPAHAQADHDGGQDDHRAGDAHQQPGPGGHALGEEETGRQGEEQAREHEQQALAPALGPADSRQHGLFAMMSLAHRPAS